MIDLTGWVIALLGSRSLIGKPEITAAGLSLSPVYELTVQTVSSPKGPLSRRIVRPVLFLASVTDLEMPENITIIAIDKLAKNEQADLAMEVTVAEDMAKSLRSGLAIG
jgi:hypothetical protein